MDKNSICIISFRVQKWHMWLLPFMSIAVIKGYVVLLKVYLETLGNDKRQ